MEQMRKGEKRCKVVLSIYAQNLTGTVTKYKDKYWLMSDCRGTTKLEQNSVR